MDLDRPTFGQLRLETVLHLSLLGAAVVLRLLWVGVRPLHHDESIHAYYAWRILTVGPSDYRYDPTYHGPTLYFLGAIFQWLLGPSEVSARMVSVVCGAGLVALAWPLRPLLGRREALFYAALVTLSPTLGYYSRSLRHDVPMAFFTLGAVVFFLHYVLSRRRMHLYAAGALISLAASTKEDIYLTAFAFANVLWITGLWTGKRGESVRKRAATWLTEVRDFLRAAWIPIATSLAIALTAYIVLYTSLLTHPENWNATARALSYWWGQHSIKRIGGPPWYYVPLEVVYEPLIFVPALIMLGRWLWSEPPSRLDAVFAAWAVLNFALYAWAQEKVPWLLVPLLVPQALLAARYLASLETRQMLPWVPVTLFAAWSLVTSNYLYDAPRTNEAPDQTHNEPMVYVQSTYDIREVMSEIEAVGAELGTGKRTPLVVVGEATWPLSWYLREYPVHWGVLPQETSAPILIMDPKDADRVEKDLGDAYKRRRFSVRGWWVVDWNLMTPANVARFLIYRLSWNPPGTTDAAMLVARDLPRDRALAKVRLTPAPPVRNYASVPQLPSQGQSFGGRGAGAGEFQEPRGLAIDPDGNLLVADSQNNRIQKLDRSGKPLATWGGISPGDGPRQFRTPCGVTVGSDGSIYVADTWNHRIQKLSAKGDFVLQWREEDPGLWGPRAIVAAPDGSIFVADTGNKRILAYDPGGQRLLSFGSEGNNDRQFIEPVGLAIDPQTKTLYVADTGNHRVQFFGLDGTFQGKWTVYGWEEFYTEPYLAWHAGALWATDSFNRRVNAYEAGGNLLKSIGDQSGSGDLAHPIGVAVSSSGEVFVSDTMNHRILVFADPLASR